MNALLSYKPSGTARTGIILCAVGEGSSSVHTYQIFQARGKNIVTFCRRVVAYRAVVTDFKGIRAG